VLIQERIPRSLNDACCDCLPGNFAADSSGNDSDTIRACLNAIFTELERSVLYCLEAAVAAHALRADTNCEQVATFIVSSMHGAFLRARTHATRRRSSI
jgi:TetR/AcrR family transcriptional repressor of nem operon